VFGDSSIPWRIDLVAADTVGFRCDLSSDTAPGSRVWIDDLVGSRTLSKTGGLSISPEETATGNDRDDIDKAVPPDSPLCEIEGAGGAGDGSVGLTFCLSAAFGSLLSEQREAWTRPGTAGEFTFPEETIRGNNQ
jgi:hypothetical protein